MARRPRRVIDWDYYRGWLVERVDIGDIDVDFGRYQSLFHQLHEIDFEWSNEYDQNREGDGLYLREEFYYEMDLPKDFFDMPCSVLEMLVALAIRIDDEYTGSPGHDDPKEIFWEMLCNLELDAYDDISYDQEDVWEILRVWMDRKYDRRGGGGLFPLQCPPCNQRNAEIWQQMIWYVNERGHSMC